MNVVCEFSEIAFEFHLEKPSTMDLPLSHETWVTQGSMMMMTTMLTCELIDFEVRPDGVPLVTIILFELGYLSMYVQEASGLPWTPLRGSNDVQSFLLLARSVDLELIYSRPRSRALFGSKLSTNSRNIRNQIRHHSTIITIFVCCQRWSAQRSS